MIFPVSKSVSVNVTAPVSTAVEPAGEALTTHPLLTFVVISSFSPSSGVPPVTVRVPAVLSLPTELPLVTRP